MMIKQPAPVSRVFAIVALVALLIVGCSKQKSPPTSSPTRPSSTAQLSIAAPSTGQQVPAGQAHVKLSLAGATIVKETNKQLKPDRGHIHLTLDGKLISMTYGLEQDVEVSAGPHLLQAEFVASDHAPFDPRVVATVSFSAA